MILLESKTRRKEDVKIRSPNLAPFMQNPNNHKSKINCIKMDEDGIALVLARASELRSKITNCIHNSSTTTQENTEDEAESLLNIHDSLEALEAQLSSLQALQQQQWYEKEASLAEIDFSRKKLLQNLKEYKGEDLDVIHEATAFASSTVEMENNDLLLPPYPTRPTSDNASLSQFSLTTKIPPTDDPKSAHQSKLERFRQIIGAATKTVFTFVGFIAVLHLSGFEPRLNKRGTEFKLMEIDGDQGNEVKTETMVVCPPGKVLVVENGVTRCLVKERVEIPFEPVVTIPDVNYGCG